MKKFLALCMPFLVLGCSSTVEIENRADYKCGSEVVNAKFLDDDSAVLNIDGTNYVLQRDVSASGAKYENVTAGVMFWTKGGEGTLELKGQTYPTCKEMVD